MLFTTKKFLNTEMVVCSNQCQVMLPSNYTTAVAGASFVSQFLMWSMLFLFWHHKHFCLSSYYEGFDETTAAVAAVTLG